MKVAVIGLGNMGKKIVPALKTSPHVTAIVGFDPCPDAAERARSSGIDTVASYEAILSDEEVTTVFIAAPNHLHCELTIAALEAGKAVMCEKPMATRLEDAQRMVETAERLGGFLQIGFELRYSLLYQWVKERIDAGLIGEVVNSQCTYVCSEFHGKGSWRNEPSSGGGMFGEKLCHYVDLPRWWIGSPVTEVRSVSAPNVVPYYGVRDNFHTTLRFASGAVSHLTFMMPVAVSLRHDPLQNHITAHGDDGHELRYLLYGTKGAIETDVFHRRFRRWEFSDTPQGLQSCIVEDLTWPEGEEEDNRHVHNTTDQALDILYRVASGLPAYTNPRDSLETMQVVFTAEAADAVPTLMPNASLTSAL